MPLQLVILIPIYKASLNLLEQFSLDYLVGKAGQRQMRFVAPSNVDKSYYLSRYPAMGFEHFDDAYFASVGSYNQLLLSLDFYQRFRDFDFLLIHQTDALLFKDDLDAWMSRGFDYVGAPWPAGVPLTLDAPYNGHPPGTQLNVFVGNGGFCLRNVQQMIAIIHEATSLHAMWLLRNYPEDCFFAFANAITGQLNIPDAVTASFFSLEQGAEQYFTDNNATIPTGCHDWVRKNFTFWQKIIAMNP
jgi:hypothetical protein